MWRNVVLLMFVIMLFYWRPLWHKWLKPWLARSTTFATINNSILNNPPFDNNSMSIEQAREILGVTAQSNQDAIILAHKRLIQKLHPDRGGSEYLATQVNLAKQLLLNQFKTG